MAKYKLNGVDIEDLIVVDNTNGVTIGKSGSNTKFNFSSNYRPKFGSSAYSYTKIGYKIDGVDQGEYICPKTTVYTTVNTHTHTLSANTRKILCIVVGGGAGGTGGNYETNGKSGGGGSGGGGGGLAWIVYKVNGGSLSIVVGGGGSGGNKGTDVGKIGTAGGNTTVTYNTIVLCNGHGGNPGVAASNNNNGSTNGPVAGGTVESVESNTNVIASGTRTGLSGGDGQADPENDGVRSQNGYGGAGGNGGTTKYPYGKDNGDSNSASADETIGPLQFNSVDFIDSGKVIVTGFTYNDFTGKNALVEEKTSNYGQGGPGGNGEGRSTSDVKQDGFNGNRGFALIAEYGII